MLVKVAILTPKKKDMSNLQVRRLKQYNEDCILGELWFNGEKLCVTLEPALDRDPHPGIPAGIYPLSLQKSGEVYSWMSRKNEAVAESGIPLLNNVPGRGGVEIHIGNSCKPAPGKPLGDSLGCILIGTAISGDTITGSTQAYARCYPIFRDNILAGGAEIEIIDIVA